MGYEGEKHYAFESNKSQSELETDLNNSVNKENKSFVGIYIGNVKDFEIVELNAFWERHKIK